MRQCYIGGSLLLISLYERKVDSNYILFYRIVHQDQDIRNTSFGQVMRLAYFFDKKQWTLISRAYPHIIKENGYVTIRGAYRSYDYGSYGVYNICYTECVRVIYNLIKSLHDKSGLPTVILEV